MSVEENCTREVSGMARWNNLGIGGVDEHGNDGQMS